MVISPKSDKKLNITPEKISRRGNQEKKSSEFKIDDTTPEKVPKGTRMGREETSKSHSFGTEQRSRSKSKSGSLSKTFNNKKSNEKVTSPSKFNLTPMKPKSKSPSKGSRLLNEIIIPSSPAEKKSAELVDYKFLSKSKTRSANQEHSNIKADNSNIKTISNKKKFEVNINLSNMGNKSKKFWGKKFQISWCKKNSKENTNLLKRKRHLIFTNKFDVTEFDPNTPVKTLQKSPLKKSPAIPVRNLKKGILNRRSVITIQKLNGDLNNSMQKNKNLIKREKNITRESKKTNMETQINTKTNTKLNTPAKKKSKK